MLANKSIPERANVHRATVEHFKLAFTVFAVCLQFSSPEEVVLKKMLSLPVWAKRQCTILVTTHVVISASHNKCLLILHSKHISKYFSHWDAAVSWISRPSQFPFTRGRRVEWRVSPLTYFSKAMRTGGSPTQLCLYTVSRI